MENLGGHTRRRGEAEGLRAANRRPVRRQFADPQSITPFKRVSRRPRFRTPVKRGMRLPAGGASDSQPMRKSATQSKRIPISSRLSGLAVEMVASRTFLRTRQTAGAAPSRETFALCPTWLIIIGFRVSAAQIYEPAGAGENRSPIRAVGCGAETASGGQPRRESGRHPIASGGRLPIASGRLIKASKR